MMGTRIGNRRREFEGAKEHKWHGARNSGRREVDRMWREGLRQGKGRGRRRASEFNRKRVNSALGMGGIWQDQCREEELGHGNDSGRGEEGRMTSDREGGTGGRGRTVR